MNNEKWTWQQKESFLNDLFIQWILKSKCQSDFILCSVSVSVSNWGKMNTIIITIIIPFYRHKVCTVYTVRWTMSVKHPLWHDTVTSDIRESKTYVKLMRKPFKNNNVLISIDLWKFMCHLHRHRFAIHHHFVTI